MVGRVELIVCIVVGPARSLNAPVTTNQQVRSWLDGRVSRFRDCSSRSRRSKRHQGRLREDSKESSRVRYVFLSLCPRDNQNYDYVGTMTKRRRRHTGGHRYIVSSRTWCLSGLFNTPRSALQRFENCRIANIQYRTLGSGVVETARLWEKPGVRRRRGKMSKFMDPQNPLNHESHPFPASTIKSDRQ
jgi:hypothetical protein